MNLSDKKVCIPNKEGDYNGYNALLIKDVKEFIKKLKHEIIYYPDDFTESFLLRTIDELAGKELVEDKAICGENGFECDNCLKCSSEDVLYDKYKHNDFNKREKIIKLWNKFAEKENGSHKKNCRKEIEMKLNENVEDSE